MDSEHGRSNNGGSINSSSPSQDYHGQDKALSELSHSSQNGQDDNDSQLSFEVDFIDDDGISIAERYAEMERCFLMYKKQLEDKSDQLLKTRKDLRDAKAEIATMQFHSSIHASKSSDRTDTASDDEKDVNVKTILALEERLHDTTQILTTTEGSLRLRESEVCLLEARINSLLIASKRRSEEIKIFEQNEKEYLDRQERLNQVVLTSQKLVEELTTRLNSKLKESEKKASDAEKRANEAEIQITKLVSGASHYREVEERLKETVEKLRIAELKLQMRVTDTTATDQENAMQSLLNEINELRESFRLQSAEYGRQIDDLNSQVARSRELEIKQRAHMKGTEVNVLDLTDQVAYLEKKLSSARRDKETEKSKNRILQDKIDNMYVNADIPNETPTTHDKMDNILENENLVSLRNQLEVERAELIECEKRCREAVECSETKFEEIERKCEVQEAELANKDLIIARLKRELSVLAETINITAPLVEEEGVSSPVVNNSYESGEIPSTDVRQSASNSSPSANPEPHVVSPIRRYNDSMKSRPNQEESETTERRSQSEKITPSLDKVDSWLQKRSQRRQSPIEVQTSQPANHQKHSGSAKSLTSSVKVTEEEGRTVIESYAKNLRQSKYEHDEEVASLQKQLLEMKADLLKERGNCGDERVNFLQNELQRVKTEFEHHTSRSETDGKRVYVLGNQLTDALSQTRDLEAKLKYTTAELKTKESRVQELEQQMEVSKIRLRAMEKQWRDTLNIVSEHEKHIEGLQIELSVATGEGATVSQSHLEQLQSALTAADCNYKELESKAQSDELENIAIKEKLTKEISKLRAIISENDSNVLTLENLPIRVEERSKRVKQVNEENQEINRLISDLREKRAQDEATMSSMRERQAEMESELKYRETTLYSTEQRCLDLERFLSESEKRRNVIEEEMCEMEDRLDSAEREVETLQLQLAFNKTELTEVQSCAQRFDGQSKNVGANNENVNKLITDLSTELRNAVDKLKETDERLRDSKARYRAAEEKRKVSDGLLTASQERVGELERSFEAEKVAKKELEVLLLGCERRVLVLETAAKESSRVLQSKTELVNELEDRLTVSNLAKGEVTSFKSGPTGILSPKTRSGRKSLSQRVKVHSPNICCCKEGDTESVTHVDGDRHSELSYN
mmetsp:Transcript_35981/g.36661  ORF Transcript_35981/g.36661 Transcript_35981/m.36661 type:complete len:1152 (-) Transcript_35981:261-3716(-)